MTQGIKLIFSLIIVIAVSFGVLACGNGVSVGKGAVVREQVWKAVDGSKLSVNSPKIENVHSILAAAEREAQETYLREVGDSLTTSFFEYSITAVRTEKAYGGQTFQESGKQFIVADVQVKNIFQDAEYIPTGHYDFVLTWDSGEAYAEKVFTEGMYPDHILLAQGDNIAGILVFEVPEGINNFKIVHKEVWDDGFEGSSYAFLCQI